MNAKKIFFYHFLMNFIPATKLFKLKSYLLRWCGAIVGENVRIVSSAKFYTTGSLIIGSNTWIGHEVLIVGGSESISIGNDCDIAPRVTIVSGTHKVNSTESIKIAGQGYSLPIVIGNGCWICINATILGGCIISDLSIVAPSSVLKDKYRKAVMIAGNPAKIIKELT